jgi:hypothetical protein
MADSAEPVSANDNPHERCTSPYPATGTKGRSSGPFQPTLALRVDILYLSFGKKHTAMTAPTQPHLEPGRVYRTRDLAAWTANPPRLAKRLVSHGALLPLAHGLFACPKRSRFGVVPPTDEELIRAFLDGTPFVFTGPDRWNALGLGSTALFAVPLVYNTKRSGTFDLGGRKFVLRRVAFPENPPVEWFVIDLLEHADQAATSRADVALTLARALSRNAFDRHQLQEMARRYGTRTTQAVVEAAMQTAAA